MQHPDCFAPSNGDILKFQNTEVLTLEQIKKITGEPDMSDEQAKILRDSAQGMAEFVVDYTREKHKKDLLPKEIYHQVKDPDSIKGT